MIWYEHKKYIKSTLIEERLKQTSFLIGFYNNCRIIYMKHNFTGLYIKFTSPIL